jgi:hypothetical protein
LKYEKTRRRCISGSLGFLATIPSKSLTLNSVRNMVVFEYEPRCRSTGPQASLEIVVKEGENSSNDDSETVFTPGSYIESVGDGRLMLGTLSVPKIGIERFVGETSGEFRTWSPGALFTPGSYIESVGYGRLILGTLSVPKIGIERFVGETSGEFRTWSPGALFTPGSYIESVGYGRPMLGTLSAPKIDIGGIPGETSGEFRIPSLETSSMPVTVIGSLGRRRSGDKVGAFGEGENGIKPSLESLLLSLSTMVSWSWGLSAV